MHGTSRLCMKTSPDPSCLPAVPAEAWASGWGVQLSEAFPRFPARCSFQMPRGQDYLIKNPWPNSSPNQLRARQAAQATVVTETSQEDKASGRLTAASLGERIV